MASSEHPCKSVGVIFLCLSNVVFLCLSNVIFLDLFNRIAYGDMSAIFICFNASDQIL